MSLSHARVVRYQGRSYQWIVRQRGQTLRLVVQDAIAAGQLLVALDTTFRLFQRDLYDHYYIRTIFGPEAVCQRIGEALAQGWEPIRKRLPPFQLCGESVGTAFPTPPGLEHVTREQVQELWAFAVALRNDPQWLPRLSENLGRMIPVPPSDLRDIDREIVDRLATYGGVEAEYRPVDSESGDSQLCVATRLRCWPRWNGLEVVVLVTPAIDFAVPDAVPS